MTHSDDTMARCCIQCGEPFGINASRRKLYCSPRCRRRGLAPRRQKYSMIGYARSYPSVLRVDDDGYTRVPLVGGGIAVIDAADAPLVIGYTWFLNNSGYVSARGRSDRGDRNYVLMHRVIMGASTRAEHVDHKFGDKLDNRRAYLRLATVSQNLANAKRRSNNASGFKGVSWDKSRGLWHAYITKDQRRRSLGRFTTAESAAAAYDEKARELFGEFALTNFDDLAA